MLVLVGLVVVLVAVNATIWQKERLISSGRPVALALAPVDPRSLMQGDFMALDWQVVVDLERRALSLPDAGKLVVRLVDGGVKAQFERLDDGSALRADEARIAFKMRRGRMRIATDAYFFEEGQAGAFEAARFGELRVAPDGEAILVGLMDDRLRPIRPGQP